MVGLSEGLLIFANAKIGANGSGNVAGLSILIKFKS